MKEFDSLKVMYHDRLVGRLTMGTNDTCLFQYEKEWLDSGFSISPLKLPLRADLFEADYLPFQGNFGVFEDSMASMCCKRSWRNGASTTRRSIPYSG